MKTVKEILEQSDVVVISAGAGMSCDSKDKDGNNLPDFRGEKGFWKVYPALKEKNINFMSIANPHAFKQFPELAWGFYGSRFDLYKHTTPHKGFDALLEMVKNKPYFVVTSNVDGAFQKVGFDASKIYEIHGRINKFQCTVCDNVWQADPNLKFDVDPETLKPSCDLPRCSCGELARPNIMMFGDFDFHSVETTAQENEFNKFMRLYDKGEHNIIILEFGAGTAIPSIRLIGEFIHNNVEGARLVRINPRESQGPKNIISIAKGALDAIKDDIVSVDIANKLF